jgi:predicted nucleic acid-binding protein
VDRTAVINASPLIFLSRAKQMDILRHVAAKFLVPGPVADEIRKKGPKDITLQTLDKTSWLEIVPAPVIPEDILVWGLGSGESSVLALAHGSLDREIIMDDLAGRRCAASLNIPVRGTLGIVLLAKKRGIIPKARPVIEGLIQSGMYLSVTVVDEALKRVGE